MKKIQRRRLQPRVRLDLARQLDKYCAATNTTATAVIEAALAQFLAGTSDLTAVIRRLDALHRHIDRGNRDSLIVAETLGAFIHLWYLYTPELPDEAKPSAQRQARRRFQNFVQTLSNTLGRGRPFLDDLVKDDLFVLDDQVPRDVEPEPDELVDDDLIELDDEVPEDLQPRPKKHA